MTKDDTQNSVEIVLHDDNGKFAKGHPKIGGIVKGEKHKISPTNEVIRIFEEEPERYKEFIDGYLKDPANRRHIVEMIDGKADGGNNIHIGDNIQIISPEAREEYSQLERLKEASIKKYLSIEEAIKQLEKE